MVNGKKQMCGYVDITTVKLQRKSAEKICG